MKGKLAQQELLCLEWWQSIDLYAQQRLRQKDKPLFVLHDGPPYANGPIHLGHALNYVLKDFVNRWKFMTGHDFSFVPGWDCHGLPIEAKIEEGYKKLGKKKEDVSVLDFRAQCRDFAQKWVEHQSKEFQRLGVTGDWAHPYKTMDFLFESRIVHYLFELVNSGYVYRGVRPVLWSASEKTALAEAEVEYMTISSPSIYVRFPITKWTSVEFENTSAVIWTTTPWSLPGNRAVCYGVHIDYVICQIEKISDQSLAYVGEKLIIAQDRLEDFCQAVGIEQYKILRTFSGTMLAELTASHPWVKVGYDFAVPFLPSEYVTVQAGTGLVHTAPGHGTEDFIIGQRYQLEVASPISPEGIFWEDIPVVGGWEMHKAYPVIRENLVRYNALIGENEYEHSYPHSWRSKKPLFYRATPQWFVSLDGQNQLREKSLKAAKEVTWYPASAEARMESMLEKRPDWCISRQRVWGVPIAQFVHARTGEILKDNVVQQRIKEKIATEGVDFWFTDEAFCVLDGLYEAADWVKVGDIIDVWFESGITHEVILKDKIPHDMILPIKWPASLYLEGSDQHRGWFQSSLCLSVALEDGKAPYESVLTHGFLLDEKNQKMAKSLGNVTAPAQVIQEKGADILRLWVAYENYQKDMRVGPRILAHVEDFYRRFRNTLRYALGALHGFSKTEYRPISDLGLLDRWIHHRLYEIHQENMSNLQEYNFRAIIDRLHCFCSQDLSSFYFDVCKDSLYCDDENNEKRQGVRTAFFHVLWCLVHWLAPFLCFTTEEAWGHLASDIFNLDPRKPVSDESCAYIKDWLSDNLWQPTSYWSIHLSQMPCIPDSWQAYAEAELVNQLREVRCVVTAELEKAREQKIIQSSLQAAVVVKLPKNFSDISEKILQNELLKVCLVSDLSVRKEGEELKAEVVVALGEKCSRCWRILPEVNGNMAHMCQRCFGVCQDKGSL